MRGRWFLVAALVLALLGSVFLYVYLRQLDRRVPVVVAARDLSRHELLTGAEVRVALLHPGALLPGALTNPTQTVGRWVSHELLSGEQVTAGHLAEGDVAAGTYGLGLAFRALFIPCGYGRAAGGAVWEGDRVDIVAVTASRDEPIAYRLAQNLEVLEVRDDQGKRVQAFGTAESIGGVLVAVPDSGAEAIVLAMTCGQVYLLLRDAMPAGTGGSGE